jgi:signal transduction histidine kinase
MQNIYKHAKANSIKISISLEKNVICLDITDDGEGFDTSKSKRGYWFKKYEIPSGRYRWKNYLYISKPGNGTTVNVKIPYRTQ